MSYQVLARKWRPHSFNEMVGQEHVVRALSNALDGNRLHHAYLFTGTRGVGKTTLARILAKSLNCEQGVSSKPCGQCSICREVDEGRFADLLEVDAASRTKVDQTRELLENVPYAPIRGRYKVYLIDEVHMFSDSSFNALLKTLEEPPPHVKFLLATTDPQKVPVTVLSRCLQMNLSRLPVELIQGQFQHILDEEKISYELPALGFLARMADGSMRDGLSLLDQAIAFGGGQVRENEVIAMLGAVALDRLPDMLSLVQAGKGAELLDLIAQVSTQSPDFTTLLKDLVALLHRIALVQAVPDLSEPSWGDMQPIQRLAAELNPMDTQLYYEMAIRARRDQALASDPRSGFEMCMLRMLAFRPVEGDGSRKAPPAQPPAPPPSAPAHKAPIESLRQALGQPKASAEPANPAATLPPAANSELDLDWNQLLPKLKLSGLSAQLAANCTIESWQDDQLVLNLDPACAALAGSLAETKLREVLAGHLGSESLRLNLRLATSTLETPALRSAKQRSEKEAQALDNMRNDPLVKALQDRFDATLSEQSFKAM